MQTFQSKLPGLSAERTAAYFKFTALLALINDLR